MTRAGRSGARHAAQLLAVGAAHRGRLRAGQQRRRWLRAGATRASAAPGSRSDCAARARTIAAVMRAARTTISLRRAAPIERLAARTVCDGADVVVDAIFGIGLSRPVAGVAAAAHPGDQRLRRARARARHSRAACTPTPARFSAPRCAPSERSRSSGSKLGFYLGEGPNCVGVVMFDGLDLPPQALAHVERRGCTHRRGRRRGAVAARVDARLTRASRAVCW